MSRKRKEPPQTNTLLNFFANGPSSNSFKSKRRPDCDVNGHKLTLGMCQDVPEVKKEERWKFSDADVIVIESDDDEREVEEKLADASSDVEVIVEPGPHKQEQEQHPSREPPFGSKTEETDPDVDANFEREQAGNHDLGAENFLVKDELLKMEPDEWDLTMGDEELGLDSQLDANSTSEDSCEDLTLKAEEQDELSMEEGGVESCPMCSMTFLDLDPSEIQKHVNSCLDSPQSSEPTSTIQRQLLRPLSSFPISTSSSSPPGKPELKPKSTSAFSVLMSGKAERERAAWAEAQAAEDRNFRPSKTERRKAPFYKILTGMPIAVDAFRYGSIPGVEAYFLTHAHSDHYTNLSSNWTGGPIYCSETTANLIAHMLSVDRKWLHPLPMNMPVDVPNTGGVKVTLIEANHCPGSCLFLFEGPQSVNAGDSTFKSPFVGTSRIFRYLHCGDFRASPQHVLHPAVKGKRLDTVYLDTTYLNPKYCFPPQPLVVSACAELARRIVNGEPLNGECEKNGSAAKGSIQGWMKVEEGKGKQKEQEKGDVLVVVGTYSIGKERVVKAIAKTLNTRVYCDGRKKAILHCQDDPELHALLTNKPLEAGVHVVPLGQVASDRFKEYMERWKGRWSRAVAFRPTGWTYTPPVGSDPTPSISRVVSVAQSSEFTYAHLKPARNSSPNLMQYGVPYSEHSSFAELACFALSVDCARIIATVNVGSATARTKMNKWVESWEKERKRRREAGLTAVVEYRHLEYW